MREAIPDDTNDEDFTWEFLSLAKVIVQFVILNLVEFMQKFYFESIHITIKIGGLLFMCVSLFSLNGPANLPDSSVYYGSHWAPGLGFSFNAYSLDSVFLDSSKGNAQYYTIHRQFCECFDTISKTY